MDIVTWAQTRLKLHGRDIEVDGDWGRDSIKNLELFQREQGIEETKVLDSTTIERLRTEPGNKRKKTVTPVEQMPPWAFELHRRLGWHERTHTSRIIKWSRSIGKYLGNPTKNPWCGEGVENSILKVLPDEKVPTNPFWARNWGTDQFGFDCGMKIGAVITIGWNSGGGHVGILAAVRRDRHNNITHVCLLGTNQGNTISYSWFPMKSRSGRVLAGRWPKTFPMKDYPAFAPKNARGGGGKAGTR